MLKFVVFGSLICMAVAQMNLQTLMMMNAMSGSRGAAGAAGGGNDNSMETMILCRNTPDLRMVPCAQWREVCDMLSLQKYQMPNALTCSALGVGCCIKDMATLMIINNNA